MGKQSGLIDDDVRIPYDTQMLYLTYNPEPHKAWAYKLHINQIFILIYSDSE